MIKRFLACIFFITIIGNQFLFAQKETDVINYIDKYKKFAIEEQLRTGVPASVTLAQGIHETSAGSSELALLANNHFGIKCKSNWTGETYLHDDDRKQECFRKYINVQQSFIDHSDFLRAGSRYQFLFDMEITDYVGWAGGLKRAGYATNPAYVKRLTDLVEKYNLQQYTYDALHIAGKKPGEIVPDKDVQIVDIVDDPNTNYKGLKGFWAKKGDLLQEKAVQYNIKYNRLLDINDLKDEALPADMFLFTEKKKKTGTVEFHMVKEGESMLLISQKEAMNLTNLYSFNNMKKGEEPLPGEQLSLQYRSYGAPRLIGSDIVMEKRLTEPEVKPVVAEPVREIASTPAPATVTDIIDVEKAKKVEAILTGNSGSKSEIQIAQSDIAAAQVTEIQNPEIVANPEPAVSNEPENPVEKPVEKKAEMKPVPAMPKRTYNEKGVDDEVKVLKERFDNHVYRPFERRVIAVPAKEITRTETPAKKTTAITTKETAVKKDTKKTEQPVLQSAPAKNSNAKKEAPKKDAAPVKAKTALPEPEKNISVEKTKTGVVRDAKKIEDDKQKASEARQAEAKANAKKADAKKAAAKTPQGTAAEKETKDVLQKGSKTAVKKAEVKKETPAAAKAKKAAVKKAEDKTKDTKKK